MQILSAAVAWRVYELTRDPFSLGLVGLAQFGPMFALTLYAGDVADRFPRRLILSASFAVEALCAGLFMAAQAAGILVGGTGEPLGAEADIGRLAPAASVVGR